MVFSVVGYEKFPLATQKTLQHDMQVKMNHPLGFSFPTDESLENEDSRTGEDFFLIRTREDDTYKIETNIQSKQSAHVFS